MKKSTNKRMEAATADMTAFELIKRAYDSNTLDKLRDFLSVQG